MKKIFFLLGFVLLSGFLLLMLFSRGARPVSPTATVDLSPDAKHFRYDEDDARFHDEVMGSGVLRGIYYEKLTPTDGIYYRTISRSVPLKVMKKGDVSVIELRRGVYVCDLQGIEGAYEFRFEGAILRPSGRGVFVIDLMQREPTVFSYNSFLSVDLLDTGGSLATKVTLFPSLLFRYDPENSSELRSADIIRVSTIDTVRFVDIRRKEGIAAVFGSEDSESSRFFEVARKDMENRIVSFNMLYKKAQESNLSEMESLSAIDPENPLFINPSKKEVVLKNRLLKTILSALRDGTAVSPATIRSELETTLSEMRAQNESLYNEGKDIIRQYLAISTFSSLISDNTSLATIQDIPYVTAARGVLGGAQKADMVYQGIRSIFSRYYFTDISDSQFNARLKEYLDSLVKGKSIEKSDFLYFSFFLTQYLASGPFIPDENTLHIMFYLFAVTDEYYAMVANDPKGPVILSTIFYSYNQSFTRLLREFGETFFTTSSRGTVLKGEYLSGDTPTFSQSFLDLFKDLTNTLGNDLASKRSKFYAGNTAQTGSTVRDNYTILAKTHADLVAMRDILLKYPEYAKSLELNERNRNARGILFSQDALTREALVAYLATFNDVDTATVKIRNDFKQDGYYDTEVRIADHTFHFVLYPDGHTISNVSFLDPSGKKHTFENIALSLDEKQEQSRMNSNSSDDPRIRYRQDFKNFFRVAFIERDSSVSDAPVATNVPTRPEMDTTTQLFIQNELIAKDFKNIAHILPISFNNVYATIKNGAYSIDLSGIRYSAGGGGMSYPTEISGRYLFASHSFSDLSLRVANAQGDGYEFDGASFRIRPGRIPLQSVEKYFRNVGLFIEKIRQNYRSGAEVEIDLAANTIRIGGTAYPIDLTSIK